MTTSPSIIWTVTSKRAASVFAVMSSNPTVVRTVEEKYMASSLARVFAQDTTMTLTNKLADRGS